MTGRHGPSASEMIRNGGLMNFRRALRHAARYSAQCSKAGRLLTLAEYQSKQGLSRAQAFREQQAWRSCVGADVSVLDLVNEKALMQKGWTEDQREDAIARWLSRS
jgi:hypothetical protein